MEVPPDLTSCRGSIWGIDDLTRCGRHWYVITYPLLFLLAVSFIRVFFKAAKALPAVLKASKRSQEGYEPLLQSNEEDENGSETESDTSTPRNYGSLLEINVTSKDIQGTNEYSGDESKPIIATIVCTTAERVRVAIECVLVACQAALAISAILIPAIADEWLEDGSDFNGQYVVAAFWIWLLLIVLYRASRLSTPKTSLGGLWYHSLVLYSLGFLISAVNFRSALLHPFSTVSKNYYTASFVLHLALVVLIFTSRYGDKPARLYLSNKGRLPSPEPISSFLAITSYSWLDPLIWKGYKSSLEEKDIWDLKENDLADKSISKFRATNSKRRLAVRIIIMFRREIIVSFAWAAVHSVAVFAPPIILKFLLEYIEDPDYVPESVAWVFAFLLLATTIVDSAIFGRALFIGRRICIKLRAVIIGEVYAKALRRAASSGETKEEAESKESAATEAAENTNSEDKESSSDGGDKQANIGAIINLMSVDAFKISEISGYMHYLVSASITLVVAVILLYELLGWSSFMGVAVLVIMAPLNYYSSSYFYSLQMEAMELSDERFDKTNELFQNIRIIKYFAWEKKFAEAIYNIRNKEMSVLRRRTVLYCAFGGIWFMTPIFITISVFGSYTMLQGEVLTTPIAFTALSLFNLLQGPMSQLADMISTIVQANVSINRVEKFLNEEETTKYEQLSHARDINSPHIGFQNATFGWNSGRWVDPNAASNGPSTDSAAAPVYQQKRDFKLRDLDIAFKVGELNLIAGPTGSGKTSLLMGLLGEMFLEKGKVFLPGAGPREAARVDPETGFCESVAYCAQQAWLLNASVKDNILFAGNYDEERYKAVIEACALARDLDILDAGDETEIGEKGINLSGGQKQRISLARAVYSNSRHLLLDDCLSAVDSHTAAHIYQKCIAGPLCQDRTVILVSHNIALTIDNASYIVLMDNGRVKAQGKPSEVAATGALGSDELVNSRASLSESNSRAASSANLSGKNKVKSVGSALSKVLQDKAQEQQQAGESSTSSESTSKGDSDEGDKDRVKTSGKLVQDEESATGKVSWDVYKTYLLAFSSGYLYWIAVIGLIAALPFVLFLQKMWIREWTLNGGKEAMVSLYTISRDTVRNGFKFPSGTMFGSDAKMSATSLNMGVEGISSNEFSVREARHGSAYYIGVYVLLGLLSVMVDTLKEITFLIGCIRASKKIFKDLMESVLEAKLRFFDSTPVGRIMNRFSKDIEGVDQELPGTMFQCTAILMDLITTIVIISMITPMFLVAGVVISLVYWGIGILYLNSSRELKRLDSTTKSPIFQQFGETLNGVSSIRAYGTESRFLAANMDKINENNRPFFYMWVANRWLSFRIDCAAALVSYSACCAVLLNRNKIDAGLAGISLTYAFSFNETILWLLRGYANAEMSMNSLERVTEFLHLDKEAPRIIEDHRPPANWPEKGVIEVKDLSLKYAPELPLVIKNVSFSVESFNKVGIVGRTGAGKSTIISALFRFMEPETGSITIDGVDISTIGLYDLRRALAIIPQDPTLFTGTIKSNLDPFDEYSETQIFESLRRVHLIQNIPLPSEQAAASISAAAVVDEGVVEENVNQFLNLSNPVTEGGSNLSQGQRQLICLARSLLKSPKVLLLDEATASIDYETDSKIQQTIREEFKNTTIITIAHRLRTIIDYDRILVMDQGKAIEYDHPFTLLENKDSIFYGMCAESGELEVLLTLSKEAYGLKKI